MNRFLFYLLHLDRHLVQILLTLAASLFFFPIKPVLCKEPTTSAPTQKIEAIPFRDRLQYYVDTSTQDVIEELIARERQLLSIIKNIQDEIKLRDRSFITKNDNLLFRLGVQSDTLRDSYDRELAYLIKLYDDLMRLRRIAEYGDDLNVQLMLSDTKTRLFKAVEDVKLITKIPLTAQRIADLAKAYTIELDSLLNIYDHLERLEIDPRVRDDENATKAVKLQKVKLLRALAQWGKWGPMNERDFQTLMEELQRVDALLQEIDTLSVKAEPDYSRELDRIKQSLMNRVDRTVYELMTAAGYQLPATPTVSEFIDAWKKNRLLDVKVRLTEYQAILHDLIENATESERQRMMIRDIDDALLSYTGEHNLLCEYQIQAILTLYEPYLIDKAPLLFYLAECRYRRHAYDAAAELYRQVLLDNTDIRFKPQSLVRLLQHSRWTGNTQKFAEYYQQLVSVPTQIDQEMLCYAHFLAAEELLDRRQFKDMIPVLVKINKKSDLYWSAQFLLGIAYANLHDFNRAESIFKKLADQKSYPWTDLKMAYLRNAALIRLAFLYYQQEKYELAIQTFQKVSKGSSEYDKALLGQAWAHLRLGRVDQAMQRSGDILANFITSNFQYEALVLSAYCKQLLAQEDEAMDEYRYLLRAGRAMEREKNYYSERLSTIQRAKELSKLEQEALEKRRVAIYQEIDGLKNEIDALLAKLPAQSDWADEVIEGYQDERRQIIENLNKLEVVISWAKNNGQDDISLQAERQRRRLMRILEVYQADQNIVHTKILIDFPLAARESSRIYKDHNLYQIQNELEIEKRRLEQATEWVINYDDHSNSFDQLSEKNDLTILQQDLDRLRDRISRFRVWLSQQQSEKLETNLDYWSGLAAFYLSDILDKKRKETLNELDENAQRLKTIQALFRQKKEELESRLESFTHDIQLIQNNLLTRKNRLELLERKTYFQKYYFDNKQREEYPIDVPAIVPTPQ